MLASSSEVSCFSFAYRKDPPFLPHPQNAVKVSASLSPIVKNKHNGPPNQAYVFDKAGQQAAARFAALSAMFDPGTIRHLEERGIGQGWLCVEIGAGEGSIAIWLSERVSPGGISWQPTLIRAFLRGSSGRTWRCAATTSPQIPCRRLPLTWCMPG